MTAWAAEHFPGHHVGYVQTAAETVRRSGLSPTPENLRPEVEKWSVAA